MKKRPLKVALEKDILRVLDFGDIYQSFVLGTIFWNNYKYLSFAVMYDAKNVQSGIYSYFLNKNIIQGTLQLERLLNKQCINAYKKHCMQREI